MLRVHKRVGKHLPYYLHDLENYKQNEIRLTNNHFAASQQMLKVRVEMIFNLLEREIRCFCFFAI